MMTNPVKPITSSFWITLIGIISTIALSSGIISNANDLDILTKLVYQAASGVGAIFMIGAIVVKYIGYRETIHRAMIEEGLIPQDLPKVQPPIQGLIPEKPAQG